MKASKLLIFDMQDPKDIVSRFQIEINKKHPALSHLDSPKNNFSNRSQSYK
jgi:hypothetical protein